MIQTTPLKHIHVAAAILVRKNQAGTPEIFATERGYGEYKDWWEFPGGKLEEGETGEQAIVREIQEELATTIKVEQLLTTVEWDYPQFHLTMDCYICSIVSGDLHLLEHEAARWLTVENLHSVKWLPADEKILPLIEDKIFGIS